MKTIRRLLATLIIAAAPLGNASAYVVDVYQSSTGLSDLLSAASLFSGTPTASGLFDVINMNDGQNGTSTTHFSGDSSFPGGLTSNFALQATGQIFIDVAGDYTIGARHDDGVAVLIDGADVLRFNTATDDRDTFGVISLTAGYHAIEVQFFEAGGGAHLEVFASAGSHTTFGTGNFELLRTVPEPGVVGLLGLGLALSGFFSSRRKAG